MRNSRRALKTRTAIIFQRGRSMNKSPENKPKILHHVWGNGTILGWYNDKYAFVKFPCGTRLINPNKN